jgi:hypothetical protein
MFVATLHHVNGQGTLIHGLDDIEIPSRYRTEGKPLCEHCNTRRPRKDTCLVLHESTGEFKQVGSSCLKDFLGHDSPAQIAAMCGLIMSVGELDEEFGFNGGGGSYYREYALAAVLAMAALFIRKEGRYVSNSEAKASEEEAQWGGPPPVTSTSRMVSDAFESLDLLRIRRDEAAKKELDSITPSKEDEAAANAARAWVADEMEAKSNFDHNLKTAANFELVDRRSLGIACYILPAHQKYLAKEAARKLNEQYGESEHVGTVKKREVFTLTLTNLFDIEGMYGTTTIHKFRDLQGNVVTWFASNPYIVPDEDDSKDRMAVGETYNIKATVKEHKEYKGTKETVISRAAFVSKHSNGDKQAA